MGWHHEQMYKERGHSRVTMTSVSNDRLAAANAKKQQEEQDDWETMSNSSTSSAGSVQVGRGRLVKRLIPWVALCLATSAVYYVMIKEIIETRKNMSPEARGDVRDMDLAIYSLITISSLRHVLTKYVFVKVGDFILPKDKWTPVVRQEQVARFSVVVFKFLYFVLVTASGYHILKDQEWTPASLGGNGDVNLCYRNFPNVPIDPTVKVYFLIQCGYHLHSWCFQIRMYHRKDWLEMMCHHSVAIFLIVFSYYSGHYRIGSLVLLVHDIADVVGYLMKSVVDTKYTKLILSVYALLLVTWVYTRLYVLPFHLTYSLTANPEIIGGYFATHSFVALLSVLQMLHIYWFYLFLLMGYRFSATGKAVDIQDKLKSSNPRKIAKLKGETVHSGKVKSK